MSQCMRATKGADVCRRRTSSIANFFIPCHVHRGQPVAAMPLYLAPNATQLLGGMTDAARCAEGEQ